MRTGGYAIRSQSQNAARRMRPDEFEKWLKVFLRGFDFAQQKEAKNLLKHPDRVLRETFRAAMAICGCDEEKVRYLYGGAPKSVFARNYCAYDDPRELAKLAAALDKYAISLTETPCDVSEFKISRKDEDVVMTSTPNCRFSGDVIIDIDGISGHNFEAAFLSQKTATGQFRRETNTVLKPVRRCANTTTTFGKSQAVWICPSLRLHQ